MLKKMSSILIVMALLLSISCDNTADASDPASKSKTDVSVPVKDDSEKIKIIFVELGSVNCIPCKQMQPVMKAIEEKYPNKVEVIFYDVWTKEGQPYAKQYKIRVIPTQIFLDAKGREFFRHEGFFPLAEIEKLFQSKGIQ